MQILSFTAYNDEQLAKKLLEKSLKRKKVSA